MSRGKKCAAHVHAYDTAEEYHHVRPQARGGLSVPTNMIWLCANAHSDVHYFLDEIERRAKRHERHPERVPGTIAVHYGPLVRAVARRGWLQYADDFEAGRFKAEALLWSSNGEPLEGLTTVPPYWLAARRRETDHWLSEARAHLDGIRPLESW